MNQTASHPADRIASLTAGAGILTINLANQGLNHPACAAAYRGALYAGASPEVAFEAARQEALIALPPIPDERYSSKQDPFGTLAQMLRRRQEARLELIARIRALPNPFIPAGDDIQRGADALPVSEHGSLGRAA